MDIKFKAVKIEDYWILAMYMQNIKMISDEHITHFCKINNTEFCKLIEKYGGSIKPYH
jgi:hypothetical protein